MPGAIQRRPAGPTPYPHTPGEETELDQGLYLPHTPMHVHVDEHRNHEADEEEGDNRGNHRGLDGDRKNVALLTFLYILQGIPLGLAGSIPYLLSSRKVSYKDQAIYSFVYWPFSVKLLWAPIVDSAYFPSFGRRKSWLIPTQYLLGVFMFVLSYKVTYLLGDEESGAVNVTTLTIVFFMLNFLAATQDIAVDGWALTMLSRRNVAWASTCNTVGQTAGYFLGNVVFLALESPDFCNRYLRSEPATEGLVTLAGFFYFWGGVFFVTTTLVMILKREVNVSGRDPEHGILETYLQLWKVIQLPSIISLIIILLTVKIGFAAADSVTGLKLIEEGVPRENLALLGIPMVPLQIILPLIISKYTTGPKPMNVFLKAMPFRLLMGLVFALIVWWAPSTKTSDGSYPAYFYAVVLIVYGFHQVTLYSMFVSQMAFYAGISDPAIGGTYMTLLNTINNLGSNWPATVALWFVDGLTWKSCQGAEGECYSDDQIQACTSGGGSCRTSVDGYYVESLICFLIGILWLRWRSRKVKELQEKPPDAWSCH